MASDTRYVKGLAELQKVLDTIPKKMERNVMRGALRAGMRVVQPAAQARIHSVSGQLARGLKIGTRARGGFVIARLRATGRHAFLAKFVEFGTAAHVIAAKIGGWLQLFGGVFRKSVQHPGARPKPFLRPALDSMAGAAVVSAGEYIKGRLTKQGLDVSHIRVEGDE